MPLKAALLSYYASVLLKSESVGLRNGSRMDSYRGLIWVLQQVN